VADSVQVVRLKFQKDTGAIDDIIDALVKVNLVTEEIANQFKRITSSSSVAEKNVVANLQRQEKAMLAIGQAAEQRIRSEKQVEEAVADTTQEVAKEAKSINSLEKRIQSLKKAQKDATDPAVYRKLGKEIDSTTDELEEFKKELEGIEEEGNEGIESLTDQFDGLLSTLKAVPAIGAAVAITAFAAEGVEALLDVQKEVTETTRQVETLFSGEDANELAPRIRAIAKTFDEDFNEVLLATNALAKQYGITGTEAAELVSEGFEKGANVNGEYLEILKEYPAQFKAAAGPDADKFIAFITQSNQSGLFSDKGIDTIKEGLLRLREFAPATREALEGIGLSGEEIEKQLKSGEKTAFEIIQEIGGKLDELPPQSAEVGAAIADIFGGAGEDAGLEFLTTIDDINLNLEELETTLDGVQAAELRFNNATENLKQSIADGDGVISQSVIGWENYKAGVAEALEQTNEFNTTLLNENDKTFLAIGASIESFLSGGEGAGTQIIKQINDATALVVEAGQERASRAIDLSKQEIDTQKNTSRELIADLESRIETTIGLERAELALRIEGQKAFLEEIERLQAINSDTLISIAKGTSEGINEALQAELAERARLEREAAAEAEKRAKKARADAERRAKQRVADELKFAKELEDAKIRALEDDREREIEAERLILKRKLAELEASEAETSELQAKLTEESRKKEEEINLKFNLQGLKQSQEIAKLEAQQSISDAEALTLELQRVLIQRLEGEKILLEAAGEETIKVEGELTKARQKLAQLELKGKERVLADQLKLDNLSNRRITDEADERRRLDLESEIFYLEEKKKLQEKAGQDTVDVETQIFDKKEELRKMDEESEKARNARRLEIIFEFANAAAEIFGRLNELSAVNTERDIERITNREDENQAALERRLETEITTEQERQKIADEIAASEALKEKQIAEAQRKQAERDKALALFEAGINGAAQIAAAAGRPFILPITIATVATQLGIIAATPIPQFAKGTDSAPGGLSLVGEEGPELVNLPKGAKVHTAKETKAIMSGSEPFFDHNAMEFHRQYTSSPYERDLAERNYIEAMKAKSEMTQGSLAREIANELKDDGLTGSEFTKEYRQGVMAQLKALNRLQSPDTRSKNIA